jgi:hypothetical protein
MMPTGIILLYQGHVERVVARSPDRATRHTKSSNRFVTRPRLHSAHTPRMMKLCPLGWKLCRTHTSRTTVSIAGVWNSIILWHWSQ